MKPIFFATPAEFRKWLKKYHQKETELLVGFYKKSTGKQTMTWSQSVDQALCFGWIDGVTRSIDEGRYCIRFTPRKRNSIWSSVNIKKVAALIESGEMTPAGQEAFDLRTEMRSGVYSHENENVVLAKEYEQQFRKNKLAWNFFNQQAPSYKKVMIHWIMSAKQEKTKLSRLEKTILFSEKQKRIQ
jgi:uncharacterized protein YdeI (YjbR/CyaY-like superfamily)